MSCGIITQQAISQGLKEGQNVDIGRDLHGAGISVKVTSFKKGDWGIKHKHSYAHLSVLLSGRVSVSTDDSEQVLDATNGPVSIIIRANEYHKVTALTDSVWLCCHKE